MLATAAKRTDFFLLLALFTLSTLLALFYSFIAPPEKVGGIFQQPSTFYNRAYGTKAYFQTLQKLGYHVTQFRRPITSHTLSNIHSLVMLNPILELTHNEIRSLEPWLREGGNLLVVPSAHRGICSDATVTQSIGWFQLVEEAKSPKNLKDATAVIDIPEDATSELLAGIRKLEIKKNARFTEVPTKILNEELKSPEVFLSEDGNPYGLRFSIGKGMLIALSDPYVLTNVGISEKDNAPFAVNLGMALGGSTGDLKIAFDEFHLGMPEHSSPPAAIGKMILSGHWGTGLVQSLIAGILALLVTAIRFGTPQAPSTKEPRLQSDFSKAAGALLRKAKGNRIVYQTLFQDYRARLEKLLGSQSALVDKDLVSIVQQKTEIDISHAFRDLEMSGYEDQLEESRLLEMSQLMERTLSSWDTHNANRSRH